MLTMLIDHLAAYNIVPVEWFRIIGRIAMPLYAFGIAIGYSRTSDKKKYLFRLLMYASIAQIPLTYLQGDNFYLNIIFTFSFSLALLILLNTKTHFIYKLLYICITLLMVEIFPFEYGSYGVLLVLIYRYSKGGTMFLLHLILSLLYFYLDMISQIGLFSILGTIIITFAKHYPNVRINRTFFRLFYPAHLMIIALILFIT